VRHYFLAVAGVLAIFLGLFFLGSLLDIPFLNDPMPFLQQAGWVAGAIGVGLLALDVVLPVPSNIVMISHGALFGILVGMVLSLLGSMLAALAAFWVGRRGGRLLALLVPADERAHADAVLARWGLLAIMVSRPLPLLAETILVLAGASVMRWRTAMVATFIGSIPPSLFYAWAGAASLGFEGGAVIFGGVILLAALTGLTIRQLERSRLKPADETA
jgi:uncharacterized membrane protein YdjX (TVP38/TMEM64 family)